MPLQGDGSNWKWKHKKDVPKAVVPTMNFEPAIPVSYASLLKTKCNCFVQPVISAVGVRGGRSRLYFLAKGLLQLISSHHAHYFSAETHVLILHSSFFTKMHWRCIPGWSFHPEGLKTSGAEICGLKMSCWVTVLMFSAVEIRNSLLPEVHSQPVGGSDLSQQLLTQVHLQGLLQVVM